MKMKKLAAFAAAGLMTMSLVMPVSAATITIANPAKGETYNAYKVFDVTSTGSAATDSYAYTISTDSAFWDTVSTFAATADNHLVLTQTKGNAKIYNVTYAKNAAGESLFTAANAAALASALSADTSKPAVAATLTTDADTANQALVATEGTTLGKGYYFVDTTLGSLCSLVTEDSTDTLYEKNSIPDVDKKVKESGAASYADWTDIDVIDDLDYEVTVDVGSNANNTNDTNKDKTGVNGDMTVVDELSLGMDYKADTDGNYVTVKVGDTTWTKDTDYTVEHVAATDTTKGKLTIVLKSTGKLAGLAENEKVVIDYSVEVTNASLLEIDGDKNTNTATLTYKHQTDTDTADVVTYSLKANVNGEGKSTTYTKIDGTKTTTTRTPLAGVQFTLKQAGDNGKYVNVGSDMTGILEGYVESYTIGGAGCIVTDASGQIDVEGLDAGDYILTEVKALDGYNLPTNTWTITISADSATEGGVVNAGTFTATMKDNSSETAAADIAGWDVKNEKGSLLPSTGGIGTTIFYVVGGILVVGAGVVLVAKKRVG